MDENCRLKKKLNMKARIKFAKEHINWAPLQSKKEVWPDVKFNLIRSIGKCNATIRRKKMPKYWVFQHDNYPETLSNR